MSTAALEAITDDRHARLLDYYEMRDYLEVSSADAAQLARGVAASERALVRAYYALEEAPKIEAARAAKAARVAEAAAVTAADFAPSAAPMLPGVLPSRPGLVLLTGHRGSGEKQSLGMQLALSFVTGSAPWPSAPALPPRSVLYVSKVETTDQLNAKAHALADALDVRPSGEKRLHLLGRDRAFSLDGDSTDPRGLRAQLDGSNDATPGAPVRLVVADSALHFLAPEVERSPALTAQWLARLDALAASAGVFLLLLADGSRADLRRLVSAWQHVLRMSPAPGFDAPAILDTLDGRSLTFNVLRVAGADCFLTQKHHHMGLDPWGTDVLAVMAPGVEYSPTGLGAALAAVHGRRSASAFDKRRVNESLPVLVRAGKANRLERPRGWRYVRVEPTPQP